MIFGELAWEKQLYFLGGPYRVFLIFPSKEFLEFIIVSNNHFNTIKWENE